MLAISAGCLEQPTNEANPGTGPELAAVVGVASWFGTDKIFPRTVSASVTVAAKTRDGGSLTVVREIHDHGSGVAVLPVDEERRTVLLVRQFRVPAFLDDNDGHIDLVIEDHNDPKVFTFF